MRACPREYRRNRQASSEHRLQTGEKDQAVVVVAVAAIAVVADGCQDDRNYYSYRSAWVAHSQE